MAETKDKQTPETETEQKPALARDEVEKLLEAQANKFKAEMRKANELRAKEFEEFQKQVAEKLTSQQPVIQADDDPKVHRAAEMAQAKYEAELKKLKEQVENERQAREAEKQARMSQEERTALSQALTAAGVDGARLKAAMALLYTEEKRIARNDKGEVGFKIQVAGGYEDVVSIEQGLTEWLKTDDGKAFLPPRAAGGSGTVAGRPGQPGAKGMSRDEMLARLPGLLFGDSSADGY